MPRPSFSVSADEFTCPRTRSARRLRLGRSSSIVEITRFQVQRFTVSIKALAKWFGLEGARIVVDECLAQRES